MRELHNIKIVSYKFETYKPSVQCFTWFGMRSALPCFNYIHYVTPSHIFAYAALCFSMSSMSHYLMSSSVPLHIYIDIYI